MFTGCVSKDYNKYLESQLKIEKERNKTLMIKSQSIIALTKDAEEDTKVEGIRNIANLEKKSIDLTKPEDGLSGFFGSLKYMLPSLLLM